MKKRIIGVLVAMLAVVGFGANVFAARVSGRTYTVCNGLDKIETEVCVEDVNNCYVNSANAIDNMRELTDCLGGVERKWKSGGGTSTDPGSGGGSGSGSGTSTGRADVVPFNDDTGCGEGEVKTLFFGCVGSSEGEGVYKILNLALTILTFGVGIAATIGFVIAGLQYLTARDDAGVVAKAKMRMLQIVIGLVVYAMIWAILNWLLPGGVLSGSGS